MHRDKVIKVNCHTTNFPRFIGEKSRIRNGKTDIERSRNCVSIKRDMNNQGWIQRHWLMTTRAMASKSGIAISLQWGYGGGCDDILLLVLLFVYKSGTADVSKYTQCMLRYKRLENACRKSLIPSSFPLTTCNSNRRTGGFFSICDIRPTKLVSTRLAKSERNPDQNPDAGKHSQHQ